MLTKIAENFYAHATSMENLDRILQGDAKLKSLAALAKDNPDTLVSTEATPIPFIRYKARAEDAYNVLRHTKNPNRLFFTRNGYLNNYGDAVIVKKLSDKTVKPNAAINSIPEEFTTGRRVSLRHNADIYVPDDSVTALAKKYPGIRFLERSKLPIKAFGIKDRSKAFYNKLAPDFMKIGANLKYKSMFGRKARLVGSEALGISVPGQSDIDVFVPYKTERGFSNAIKRMEKNYPSMALTDASLNKPDKKTFTGRINGQPIDVTLAFGPRAQRFDQAFTRAQNMLTPDMKSSILARKKELKNSWFLPQTRYKMYKNNLAERLGLKSAYF